MNTNDYLKKYPIQMKTMQVPSNPTMHDPMWKANHYHCIFRLHSNNLFRLYYSKGMRHAGKKPTIEEVLECLSMDFSSLVYSPFFQDWAENFGYDVDSISAKNTWETIINQAYNFRCAMGYEAFNDLVTLEID